MKVASVSDFRKNIKRYIDDVDADQEALIVTRTDSVSVVVIPLDSFNSLNETDYLLSNPKSKQRLLESLSELQAGKGQKHELIEQ